MIMDNKINIAELLKDCPKGMELDCTMFENVFFDCVTDNPIYPIRLYVQSEKDSITLTSFGCTTPSPYAKCVIFPKGKTTWEGFQRPFKDGDIVATSDGDWIGITTGGKSGVFIPVYCVIEASGDFEAYFDRKEKWLFNRLATEKEKQKLFNAIKTNGYKWNPETKTLEKLIEPKFKVGDRIRLKNGGSIIEVTSVNNDSSICVNGMSWTIKIKQQDNYELVPNKFDITTLKPFDKVLVRDHNAQEWVASLFSNYNEPKKYKYICVNGSGYAQCIPYEGNEHLFGTTDDCDEYYKTWE